MQYYPILGCIKSMFQMLITLHGYVIPASLQITGHENNTGSFKETYKNG